MSTPAHLIHFGKVPVPYTASWTAEETFYLGIDPSFRAGGLALKQPSARGEGKPLFGKPHMQRQREVIANGQCDLCRRPLKLSTKISLSHAAEQLHGADGPAILQVEPMLHRECALLSIRHCPSLRRDLQHGILRVRQVRRWRAQVAIMDATYVESIVGQTVKALGHAKIELLDWQDRDLAWLERADTKAGAN